MKPTVNENEMSTNADVMDMTMLIILLLYNYYYTSTMHPTIIIRQSKFSGMWEMKLPSQNQLKSIVIDEDLLDCRNPARNLKFRKILTREGF